MTIVRRMILLAAGLTGAAGVAAAAAASHGGDARNLVSIAAICLSHGPALLALGLHARSRWYGVAGLLLALGTAVFAGDLGMREWLGHPLFPGAAPLGGGLMILAWLGLAAGALVAMPEDRINKD
ncbi:MAG: DUF423 domain-containing protein [Devosia sp.]|uniref:DUF423 domain-containing protein n=1 Tax=Devosia sp. TaxID=1871048 RepID=UPI0024CC4948|nr:DUF423 domain-containing protein [Devosia sp.]UYO00744.1 MAG: DUF423 domain-containing protein [Devosia sp.]